MISEHALVDPEAELGPGVDIGPFSCVYGPVKIGANTKIGPHVVIGTPPQHRLKDADGLIEIGKNTIIREFTSIHAPTDGLTYIGNNVFIMNSCHIPHDARIEDGVSLSPGVFVGGHCIIQRGANIGMNSVLHQWVTIGAGCMVGMNSSVTKDIPPFLKVYGSPARLHGLNKRRPDDVVLEDYWERFEIARRGRDRVCITDETMSEWLQRF